MDNIIIHQAPRFLYVMVSTVGHNLPNNMRTYSVFRINIKAIQVAKKSTNQAISRIDLSGLSRNSLIRAYDSY